MTRHRTGTDAGVNARTGPGCELVVACGVPIVRRHRFGRPGRADHGPAPEGVATPGHLGRRPILPEGCCR